MFKPKKGEVRKPTKTISGITPVAVMLPPRKCNHGMCIYCPNMDVPQSYTPKSPVVMRAMRVNYDSYKQVRARIKAFEVMNHPTEKVELIIMGGTFLEYPTKFQYKFVKGCYDALNRKKSKSLVLAQKLNESKSKISIRPSIKELKEQLRVTQLKNEKSKHRCVALCVETRPDVCIEFIDRMREWGVTRVELGVQIIDDKIYEKVKRGHTVQDVVDATRELKNAGFKVGYHIMPGLPGSSLKKDLKLFKKLFSDERFKPDQLKIYPCQVMPSSELENLYWSKKYEPYTREETEKILIKMLKAVPRYCRVMRVMREIPPEYIVAGTTRIDLRREIERELRGKGIKLNEIRYREIGFNSRNFAQDSRPPARQHLRCRQELVSQSLSEVKLNVTKYKSSGGEEYFLEIVNKND
ncbi:MAG: tRNA uridine(34) 5-carboxymethylaminomethyl modification radical SAM/GNAT enzyme Elp3, partial [Nanoarchaeota archaeon]